MIATDTLKRLSHPVAPATLEAAGLSSDLVGQLLLKTLHFAGELTGAELSARLGLNFSAIEPTLAVLKRDHLCEIAGGAVIGGASYRYRISDAGRARAALFLQQSRYLGYAPVPLAQYRAYMSEFDRVAQRTATREQTRTAFSHLVMNERVTDELGPAISAGRSIFIYGPPGNGKTVIARAIKSLLVGEIAIPYALEVEGQIISFFNPVSHEALPAPEDSKDLLGSAARDDRRWVRCARPMVAVGGELRLESLELHYNANSGFYNAPVQALANGGLLVIDDFGRQQCSPRELLNRWLIPLESRTDMLTLETGQMFEMPFLPLVVFATNLRPSDLVDEAFLRRIPYKIFALSPTVEDYTRIFENYCAELKVPFNPAMVEFLIENFYRPREIPLRACHPRDLINQALAMGEHLGRPRHLTPELLEAACGGYFVDDREPSPAWT